MSWRAAVDRLLGIADELSDDDDLGLRKRMGVVAGYLSIVAPLSVIGTAQQHWLAIPLGLALSALSAINLAVLARSGRFDRYVVVLIAAGAVFTPVAIVIIGGVLVSSAAMFWAFLVPVYAILALGPRRATAWFGVILAVLGLVVVIDPLVKTAISPPPYQQQLLSYVFNVGAASAIVFFLLLRSGRPSRSRPRPDDSLSAGTGPLGAEPGGAP